MPTIEKIEKIEVHQLQFSCDMTDVKSSHNDERLKFRVENTSERIPQRSSTSKRELLSFVARTSAHESVAQEHSGVPNGTEDSSSTKHPDSPEVFESPTPT